MMGWSPKNAAYQVQWKSVHHFWKRRFVKDFYHKWAWRPSWSCDPECREHIKIGFDWQSVSEKKNFEIVDGRGALVYFKLTYEPSAQVS